jgi:hypothetical protein
MEKESWPPEKSAANLSKDVVDVVDLDVSEPKRHVRLEKIEHLDVDLRGIELLLKSPNANQAKSLAKSRDLRSRRQVSDSK